jgi:Bacterial Ig-like domain (group 2)
MRTSNRVAGFTHSSCVGLLMAGFVALSLAGCTGNSLVDNIQVSPSTQSVATGGTVQFTAAGTTGHGSHPATTQDVTDQVTWTSSAPSVATVNSSGAATGVAAGTATITASMNGYTGIITSTSTLTVSGSSSGGSGGGSGSGSGSGSGGSGGSQEPLLSINIVPGNTTVSNQGMTGQYLAFGTYSSAPTVRDITNQVTWISLLPEVASIDSYGAPGASGSGGQSGELAGLATAEGYTGSTDIYAEATNPDGTVVLSNAQTFTCKDSVTSVCDPSIATPQFATVSVFIEGENTSSTGEYVTAPSDTGTPNLIHCGPDWTGSGGQVCLGTYEVSSTSTVTLTENLPAGSSYFGGWSTGTAETQSCTIQTGSTTSNTCPFTDPTSAPSGWSCNTVTSGTGTSASSVSSCYEPIPCTPAAGYTLANSPTCTLPLLGNATVGVIFY